MTITCSPLDVVLVWTSCCGVLFSFPAWLAFVRSRWMLANTAERSAANASPRRVVHSICDAMRSTTSGKRTIAAKLWSNPDFVAASWRSLPLSVGFAAIHSLSAATLAGLGGAEQHLRQKRIGIEGDGRE